MTQAVNSRRLIFLYLCYQRLIIKNICKKIEITFFDSARARVQEKVTFSQTIPDISYRGREGIISKLSLLTFVRHV